MAHVGFYGSPRDAEPPANIVVRKARRNEVSNLALPPRDRAETHEPFAWTYAELGPDALNDILNSTCADDPTANVTIDVRTATFRTTSTDAVETFSDAGSSSAQTTAMRFNADSTMASGGFWIYNLDTNGLTIGTT